MSRYVKTFKYNTNYQNFEHKKKKRVIYKCEVLAYSVLKKISIHQEQNSLDSIAVRSNVKQPLILHVQEIMQILKI